MTVPWRFWWVEVGEGPALPATFTLRRLSSQAPVTRGPELKDMKSPGLTQLLFLEEETTWREEGICPRSTRTFFLLF